MFTVDLPTRSQYFWEFSVNYQQRTILNNFRANARLFPEKDEFCVNDGSGSVDITKPSFIHKVICFKQ
ncbi:hypothetical protein [Mastigocoleus sp. MO_188.B34]|uniref:hypothetical protein n=1 Tax=Mastigocoleus sp. MO_188.B34 TaxID=3036635 RepID=UPI002626C0D0|nr:hypothetical protein [Mastigocoleus sp. MO_188.B34]MDJ0693933.1 hypothetical protein [Mastigocoleus sp. MO_188.B34]